MTIIYILVFIIIGEILRNKNTFFHFLYILPGTIFHELSHFIFGMLFFASPVNFSLIPKKNENGWTLGSVSFKNINFFNAVPISMAPLILVPLSYSLYQDNNLLIAFIIYECLFSSIPSSQDINVAKSNIAGIILYIAILIIGGSYVIQTNHDYISSFFS